MKAVSVLCMVIVVKVTIVDFRTFVGVFFIIVFVIIVRLAKNTQIPEGDESAKKSNPCQPHIHNFPPNPNGSQSIMVVEGNLK